MAKKKAKKKTAKKAAKSTAKAKKKTTKVAAPEAEDEAVAAGEAAEKPAKKKKAKKKRAKRKTAEEAAEAEWMALNEKRSTNPVKPYKLNENFTDKENIDHPKFGLGYVIHTTPTRLKVVFKDGTKNLVHNFN